MSLLNSGKQKDKNKGKQSAPGNKSKFITPKSSSASKGASSNKKLTGGSQRGS
jgi:hypothetical protein